MKNTCICDTYDRFTLDSNTPQREFSSIQPHFSGTLLPNKNSISGKVWNHEEPVYWQLEKDGDTMPGIKDEKMMIKKAVLAWSLLIGLKVRQRNRKTADTHIKINFMDDNIFKKRPNVLAFAYGPSTGIGGDITFNPNHVWTPDGKPIDSQTYFNLTGKRLVNPNSTARTYNFQHTFTHELGHAYGMPHLEGCKSCVMFPTYNKQVLPQALDYHTLLQLYPKRRLSSWLMEVLLAKVKRGIMR